MCRQFRNGKLYQKTDWIVATDFRYLRPRKAALLRRFYEDFSRNLHPLRCVAVDGATVVRRLRQYATTAFGIAA